MEKSFQERIKICIKLAKRGSILTNTIQGQFGLFETHYYFSDALYWLRVHREIYS